MDPVTLMSALPWVIALACLAGVVAYLLKQLAGLRNDAAKTLGEQQTLRSENIALTERLAASAAGVARLESEIARRDGEAAEQLNRVRAQTDTLVQRTIELEAANAALTTKVQRIAELSRELEDARHERDAARQSENSLRSDYAGLQSQTAEERKAAAEKIRLLEQAEIRLTKEFENLANRIFEEKQQKFNESSKTSVEALLNPVRQQLTDFRKKVEDIYDSENKDRASLRAEISQLKSLNERISLDALNLTRALKGDSKVRGNWGEIQLERVLEQSGLTKGREYEIQTSLRTEDGQRLQPDVVVHLPEKKDVVIDSKVSLLAYEQYHASDTDEDRQRHADAHIASLRNHINQLSAKSYDELIGLRSLDLVILFVPIEPALLLALEHRPTLYEEAFAKRILLVSPSTLMGTLQIIHNIWRYEYQNRHTQEIATKAGSLYDAFVNFVESLEKIGEHLRRAIEQYETTHKRLTSGRGNLVTRTEKLKTLGIKAKKALPPALLEEAGAEDELPDEAPGAYSPPAIATGEADAVPADAETGQGS